jgi:hypothetical protein
MNAVLDIGWALVSGAVALCVGTRMGKRYIRGRLSNGWVLVLSGAVSLFAACVTTLLLHVPARDYIWLGALIGALAYGALE